MLKKRSVSLAGHSTSIALEREFWDALEAMAGAQGLSLTVLIARIDRGRGGHPLASALRLATLRWALDGAETGRRLGRTPSSAPT